VVELDQVTLTVNEGDRNINLTTPKASLDDVQAE
jgi:hypothetical protein